jgi:hypothetical protein
MTDTSQGGTPAGEPGEGSDAIEELGALWEELEGNLGVYLATMVDPDEGDHLIIELTDPDPEGDAGCPPYAQFAAFGAGQMIRAEVSGNAYLRPQYRLGEDGSECLTLMGWSGNDEEEKNWYVERPVTAADEIAHQVVWALRDHFVVAHPQLLTYQAWGPAADAAGVLGLCATADVPLDEPTAPAAPGTGAHESVLERLALKPGDRDDLLHFVEDLLREKYEAEPTVDDDGDYVLQHLGQPLWVRVRVDQPAVEIMARVAHDVHSRRATAVEIGLLNRDNLWVRWTLRDRTVWQTLVLPGSPFVPSHLDAMLDLFLETMTATRDDLAYRTRAKVA